MVTVPLLRTAARQILSPFQACYAARGARRARAASGASTRGSRGDIGAGHTATGLLGYAARHTPEEVLDDQHLPRLRRAGHFRHYIMITAVGRPHHGGVRSPAQPPGAQRAAWNAGGYAPTTRRLPITHTPVDRLRTPPPADGRYTGTGSRYTYTALGDTVDPAMRPSCAAQPGDPRQRGDLSRCR